MDLTGDSHSINVRLVVFHEAAHAVVANALGVSVDSISIEVAITADVVTLRGMTHPHEATAPRGQSRWERRCCLDRIAIALAGHAGVQSLLGVKEFWEDDPALLQGPPEKADLNEANMWLDRLWPPPSALQRPQVMRRAWKEARRLIDENEAALQLLAYTAATRLEQLGNSGSVTIQREELSRLLAADDSM